MLLHFWTGQQLIIVAALQIVEKSFVSLTATIAMIYLPLPTTAPHYVSDQKSRRVKYAPSPLTILRIPCATLRRNTWRGKMVLVLPQQMAMYGMVSWPKPVVLYRVQVLPRHAGNSTSSSSCHSLSANLQGYHSVSSGDSKFLAPQVF